MKKVMRWSEAKLLTERSKMVSEILMNILSEQPLKYKNINTPMFKVFDLVDKPKNDNSQAMASPMK
jgi:hypothetical protein